MNEKLKKFTWDNVVKAEMGDIFEDRFEEGMRFIILRGPFHICAYIGVPETHPLAGHSYDDLPIQCHGGLTYGAEGGGGYLPAGFFWYGWDYGHYDDYTIMPELSYKRERTGKKWTPEMVDGDSWSALYEMGKLLKLSEAIAAKAMGWRKT